MTKFQMTMPNLSAVFAFVIRHSCFVI